MPEEPLQIHLEATGQHPGHYILTHNTTSPYPITLNPDNVTVSDWLRRLQPVLSGENDPAGQLSLQELMRNMGTWLWQGLLPDDAPPQLRDPLTNALRTGRSPLLLTLPETLTALPWELLCDPQQSAEKGFLARRRPLIRFTPSIPSIPSIVPPLRVLLLISSPPTLGEDSRVDVESERAAVELAVRDMREAGSLHLLVEDIVTLKRVQNILVKFKPHIVHYIGHGGYNDATGGILLWEDEQGNEFPLASERLAELLRPRNLHAVLLHACKTGRSNAHTDTAGVAGTLLKEGIPTVIAQQANFTYESSQRASEAWYTALTAGQSFADALFEVRQALTLANRPDWAVPILQGSTSSLIPVLDPSIDPVSPDPLLNNPGVTDLPTPTGVFVGRHPELRALRLMLENTPGTGPVMALITGPGGVGKSTLATQAVTRYAKKYKAVLTLSCQGFQGVDLFLQRIGEFLKQLDAPGFLEQCLPDPKLSTEAKIEQAIHALNLVGPLLLVLDNLESVQHEDQTLSDPSLLYLLQKLLTNLRTGRVLITGRYEVKNLLPAGKFAANLLRLDLNDLSPYETNQLLLRHPALARLGETVRQTLITEFGGLPYVYDLLSSDAAKQSLDRLIHDVQNRITEERKQRSDREWQEVRKQVIEFAALQEVIFNRLSLPSRTLLEQLAVLHRPFPLEAIEQGLSATRTAWQPLLDWSLMHYDAQEQSYHLHSLTRRYVDEDLLEEVPRKEAQKQLASWYEQYADQASHNLSDYLEAHRLLQSAGQAQQAGKLVMQLAETLRRFGLYPLLHNLCQETLNDIGESDKLLTASILDELGNIAYLQSDYDEARSLYQQSLDLFECLGNQLGKATSLHQLGTIAQDQGDYDHARSLFLQSFDIFEQLGDQHGKAISLHHLGMIAQDQGDYDHAHSLFLQSLDIDERLGNQSGKATSLHHLGMIAQYRGDYDHAHSFLLQSLDIAERISDQRIKAQSLHQLGIIAQDQGDYDHARSLYQQSLDIKDRLGDQRGKAQSLHHLGIIAQYQGDYDHARSLYQQSLDIAERLGNLNGKASSLHHLGIIAQYQGDYDHARSLSQQSLDIKERLGDQRGKAQCLHQLGIIAQNQGDYDHARSLFLQSLDIDEHLGNKFGKASSLGQLGILAYDQGDLESALQYTIQAYILLEALQSPSLTTAQRKIARIRSDMGEVTFMTQWQTLTENRPLPILSTQDTQKLRRQLVIDFVQTPTWNTSKRFLEAHHELLQPEIDTLLQELATLQENDDNRELVENRRLLLAECRDNGIDAAYAKYQEQPTEETDANETIMMKIKKQFVLICSIILKGRQTWPRKQ